MTVPVVPDFCGFVDCSGFRMFLCHGDDGVAARLHVYGKYEPMSMKVWCELAGKSKTIVDIGAHTGVYTLAAMVANPEALVSSYEPYSLNYARLLVNLRSNGLPWEQAFPYAVSDGLGAVPFEVRTKRWYLSSGGSVGRGSPVQAVTLDRIRAGKRIDLVKIDVEGHEEAVFRGGKGVLANDRPDMLIECLTELPVPYGYEVYIIDEVNMSLEKTDCIKPVYGPDGVLESRRNRLLKA